MSPKKALAVLAMAREGRGDSAAEVDEAQRTLGFGLGHLRTQHNGSGNRRFVAKTDDETRSDLVT